MRAPTCYPYASLEAACAATGSAHRDLDEAEGAHVEGDLDRAGVLARAGLREIRIGAAHLGYGLVPLDDLPQRDRAEAARLMQSQEPEDWFDEMAARSDERQARAEERARIREEQ